MRRILLDLRSLSGIDAWSLDPILLGHLRASDPARPVFDRSRLNGHKANTGQHLCAV